MKKLSKVMISLLFLCQFVVQCMQVENLSNQEAELQLKRLMELCAKLAPVVLDYGSGEQIDCSGNDLAKNIDKLEKDLNKFLSVYFPFPEASSFEEAQAQIEQPLSSKEKEKLQSACHHLRKAITSLSRGFWAAHMLKEMR